MQEEPSNAGLEGLPGETASPSGLEDRSCLVGASELCNRTATEPVAAGILWLEPETGMIMDVNNALVLLFRCSREKFVGKRVGELAILRNLAFITGRFAGIHAPDYVRYKKLWLTREDGPAIEVELTGRIKLVDGKRLLRCSISDIHGRSHAEGNPKKTDKNSLKLNGTEARPKVLHRKAEIEEEWALADHFLQSHLLEAVGRLAGGVAHSLNNTLMIIMGNVELVQGQAGLGYRTLKGLDSIMTAAKRSAKITRQLLAFARKQVIFPEVLDLNTTIGGMVERWQRLIGEDIELVWRPGVDLWAINIDPSQVEEIILNLLEHARDAIAETGRVTLETRNVVIEDNKTLTFAGEVSGDAVMLAVSHNGRGMDMVRQERIFEPFRAINGGGNTGLGLASVYGIVRQNRGHIHVTRKPRQYTTLRIYLPRTSWKTSRITHAETRANGSV